MSLQKYTGSLPEDKQFKVAIRLARLALSIWQNYADKNTLTYRDTVVGLTHVVDRDLLKNTIDEVEAFLNKNEIKRRIGGKSKLLELRKEFDDPIIALQDNDWELPNEVQKTFYAVYNLIDTLLGKKKTAFNELTIYVSINQLAEALETSDTLTFDEIHIILDGIQNGK